MDEEERNYCCLALLLLRVGNPCLRLYFKNKWNAATKYIPWTDCTQNGTDLLLIFKPHDYDKVKVQSGDVSTWDLSLLVNVLLYSRPPRPHSPPPPLFVTAPNLVTALKTLRELRNVFCHSARPRITTPEFKKKWTDACDALSLFCAVADDFVKVKEDVTKPSSELLLIVKNCADQDQDILDALDQIKSEIEQLQKGQGDIKDGQSRLQQGQDTIHKGQSRLQQGQDTMQEGQSRLQQGQDTMQEGQSGLQQGLDTIRERQWRQQSEMMNCFLILMDGMKNIGDKLDNAGAGGHTHSTDAESTSDLEKDPSSRVNATSKLGDDQKRWLVVGICQNKILAPTLRHFLEPKMLSLYTNLKTKKNIDEQVHGAQLTKDGKCNSLNYGSINDNVANHRRTVALYDYRVNSALDLAKLYLQPFMAKFSGFDDSCDLSAALNILSSASAFSTRVQDLSKQVRNDIRNEWGHCNFSVWDETKFNDCFKLMKDLVKALNLNSEDEKKTTEELEEWKTKALLMQTC